MPIKAFINNQENGIITYKGDTEPCKVYIDGNLVENISYISQSVEGVNSVEYSSEYKKNIRTMQIDGNSEQFQGTFAPQSITIPTSYVIPSSAPIMVSETPITVPNGARLTLTANKTGNGNVSSLPDNGGTRGFIVIISDSRDDIANNYTEILEDYGTPQYSPTPNVSGQFYIGIANFLSGGIDNPQSYWDFLRANYTFTLSTEGNTVPNPNYPQPIHNANDNGMPLELRGANLFNRPDVTSAANNEYYKNLSSGGFILQPNTTYTVSFDYEFISVNEADKPYWSIGRGVSSYTTDITYNSPFPNFTKGRAYDTFTTPSNLGTSNKLFFRVPRANTRITCEVSLSNFMLNYGEEALPFEPYFTPTTIAIPPSVTVGSSTIPLRFAKYKNADYLLIDRTNGTVKYYQYSTVGDPTKPLSEQLENIPPLEYTLYDKANKITTDLGQALFELPTENQTNIITITSTPSVSKLSVNYAKYGGTQ